MPPRRRPNLDPARRTMIKVDDLSKHFGAFTAVDHLNFEVGTGEVLGFLGPNGAGKSTTMKMITGFMKPSSGRVEVCGCDIETDAVAAKRIIGYTPEGAPAYGEMTVREFLKFILAVRRVDSRQGREGFADVVEKLELEPVLHQPIETLSKGFKRRVGLAQALIHDPTVLIMDEPTDGLDPNQKHQVRQLINSLTADKIVVISTHILEEVTSVCTRTLIISGGRLLIDATPDELLARSRFHNAVSMVAQDPQAAAERLRLLPQVKSVEANGRLFAFPSGADPLYPAVNRFIKDQQLPVSDLRVETGRLDEVFRELTKGEMS